MSPTKIIISRLFLNGNIFCGARWNRLAETVPTSTHNICFRAEIRKIQIWKHLLARTMKPAQYPGMKKDHSYLHQLPTEIAHSDQTHHSIGYSSLFWRKIEALVHMQRSSFGTDPSTSVMHKRPVFMCNSFDRYRLDRSKQTKIRRVPDQLIFLFLNENICCGYSFESSRWDHSN